MSCLALSRQPSGWLEQLRGTAVEQHSSLQGWGPRQTGRLAGPGPPTGPLAPAQDPCPPAEACLGQGLQRGPCRVCAAVQRPSFHLPVSKPHG